MKGGARAPGVLRLPPPHPLSSSQQFLPLPLAHQTVLWPLDGLGKQPEEVVPDGNVPGCFEFGSHTPFLKDALGILGSETT